jgi:hypothetical protein
MSDKGTYEDAKLILQLYEMRREERMRQAREWFVGNFRAKTMEDFQKLCPPGSGNNASFRMVVSYWEMVASLITEGPLNQELFFASGQELLVVFERIRDLLPKIRESNRNPKAFANLEEVAGHFIEWWEKRAPGAHSAFKARIG